jgi:hypothetical protein
LWIAPRSAAAAIFSPSVSPEALRHAAAEVVTYRQII